jgi:hypothetical protein
MQPQRHNQSKPEPIPLFAAGEQRVGLEVAKIVELGHFLCFGLKVGAVHPAGA